LYEGLGLEVAGTRANNSFTPPEDALILWKGSLERPPPPV